MGFRRKTWAAALILGPFRATGIGSIEVYRGPEQRALWQRLADRRREHHDAARNDAKAGVELLGRCGKPAHVAQ